MRGIALDCHLCKYHWVYHGESTRYATCPMCVRKVKISLPTPGSSKATEMGCTCPILDNSRGKGYKGRDGVFVMSFNCPLHRGKR